MLRKIFSKKTIKNVKNVTPAVPLPNAEQPGTSVQIDGNSVEAKQTSRVCCCPLDEHTVGVSAASNAAAKLEQPNEMLPITLPIKTDIDKALKSALKSENSTDEPAAAHEVMFMESDESSMECSEEAICECYCYLDEAPPDQHTLQRESTIEFVESSESLKGGYLATASQFDLPTVGNTQVEPHGSRALSTKDTLNVIHEISEHLLSAMKRQSDDVDGANLTGQAEQDGIRTNNAAIAMNNGERVKVSMKRRPTFVNTESLFQLGGHEMDASASSSDNTGMASACNSRHVFINYDKFMGGDAVSAAAAAAAATATRHARARDGDETAATSCSPTYNAQDVVSLVKRTIEIENSLSDFNANDSRLLSIQCFDKTQFPNTPKCAEPKFRCGEVHERGVAQPSRSWEFKDENGINGMVIENDSENIVVKRIPMDGDELIDDEQRAHETAKCCTYKLTCGPGTQAGANAAAAATKTTLTLDIFTDPLQNGAFRRYFATDLDETSSSKFLRAVEPEGSIKMTTFLEPNTMGGSEITDDSPK